MVNTAKRRRSTRIESRDHVVNSPSHDTTASISSASTPFSYYYPQSSSSTQDQVSFPATTEPYRRNSTRTTRHTIRSHDTVPEIPRTTEQMPPLSSPVTTSIDAKKASVRSWILANYEMVTNAKAVIPRSTVYEHYRYSCSLRNMEPVNAAMFGKMIRETFPDIKTRRLGIRGQSKYQYGNIQRIESPRTDRYHFTELPPANPIEPSDQQQQQHSQGLGSNAAGVLTNFDSSADPSSSRPTTSTTRHPTSSSSKNNTLQSIYDTQGFPSNRLPPPIRFTPSSTSSTSHLPLAPRLGDLLSDLSVPNKTYQQNYTPPSPSRLDSSSSSSSTNFTSMPTPSILDPYLNDEFAIHYNHHCRDLYNAILAGQFDQIQGIYERFYYEMPAHYQSLVKTHKMTDAIWRWDCLLYDSLVVNLLPEVDTPTTKRMVSGLLQLTRTLPNFLLYLLRDYSATLRQKKYDVAGIFIAKIRRHLTLNHVATVASDVLLQLDLVENMKADWEKLDAGAIQGPVSWMSDCQSDDFYQIVEQDILRLLDDHSTLKKWINWVESLIDKYLPDRPKGQKNTDIDEYLKTSKQFMLKWKVYTGLIMQEFYTMNAFSTDSWKTLQYFLDELVLYHVEERIAKMNYDINWPERASRVNTPFSASTGLLNIHQGN